MNLCLIESLYNSEIKLPIDEKYYRLLLADSDFMVVAPQIYYSLMQQQRLDQIPLFFQKSIKERFNETFYQNLFIKNQTLQILLELEEHCIEVIPLKGPLFSEKYFGHLGARTTSDIDLLIRHTDLDMAKKLVKSLGFDIEESEIPNHFHCCFSKKLPGSPIPLTVELHWELLWKNTSSLDINEFWLHASPYNKSNFIKELSPYHTFYMICLHGWRHKLDSVKHYLDIVHMVTVLNKDLDYSRLYNDVKLHRNLKRILKTISAVYEEFSFLDSIKVFPYKRSNGFLDKKIINKRYRDFIDYQFLSYDSFKHILIDLTKWMIPPNYEMPSNIYLKTNNKFYMVKLMYLYKKRFSDLAKLIVSKFE